MRVTRRARSRQRGVDLYHAELEQPRARQDRDRRASIPTGIDPPIPPSGPACDAELPRSIRMQVPNTEQDVIFQYKEAKWNPPIIPGAFQMQPPGGVHSVFVTCGKEAKP